jgi:hypothetical protein
MSNELAGCSTRNKNGTWYSSAARHLQHGHPEIGRERIDVRCTADGGGRDEKAGP